MSFYQLLKLQKKSGKRRLSQEDNHISPKPILQNFNGKKLAVFILATILVASATFVMAKPAKGMNRAQFCKQIVEKYDIPLVKKAESPVHFTDVPRSSKYFVFIETAYQRNLVNPPNPSKFYPLSIISKKDRIRAEKVAGRIGAAKKIEPLLGFRPAWLFAEFGQLALGNIPTQSKVETSSVSISSPSPTPLNQIKPQAKKPNAKLLTKIPDWVLKAKKASVTATGNFYVEDSVGTSIIEVAKGGTASVAFSNGTYIATTSGGKAYASNDYIRLSPKLPAVLEVTSYADKSYNGKLNFNRFRGDITIKYSAKSKKMWVVNELSTEDYLRGIAEASPKDNIEYLKTLSLAVRSYATYYAQAGGKHKGEPFDLTNSRKGNGNDQVYAGYNFESIIPQMGAAASSTSGQIITFNGKAIWTPFSSGTNGRTRSASEVFGRKDMPWCQGALDPYGKISNWATLPGNHMVGLSTAGARGYINKEKRDYVWVLKHYFSNIEIKQLQTTQKIRISIYGF